MTALFAGPSGTGKTMTAEILAAHLDLDLYRIDLAGVVSKYVLLREPRRKVPERKPTPRSSLSETVAGNHVGGFRSKDKERDGVGVQAGDVQDAPVPPRGDRA